MEFKNVYFEDIPVHTIKAYCVIKGTTPFIRNLSAGWRWVVTFMPQPIYPLERNPVHIKLEPKVGPRASLEILETKKITSSPEQ